MKKALVAIDLSSISSSLIDFALRYAKETDIEKLDFIHVMEFRDQEIPLHKEFAGRFDQEKVKNDIKAMIRAGVEKTKLFSVAHNLYIRTGTPYAEIVKMAETEGHEIIMIGHRGMNNLEEFFIGSVAAKVVRHAPCDVLVHRPGK